MNLLTGAWPFWLSGIIIGIEIPIMYYLLNSGPGVSSGYGTFLKLIIPKSKLRFLNIERFKDKFGDNLFFIIGIVLGGFLAKILSGSWHITSSLEPLSQAMNYSTLSQGLWLFTGGIIMMLGARTADGCTSGNSIHGIATLQASGLVATIGFMAAGFLTTYIMKLTIMGGI